VVEISLQIDGQQVNAEEGTTVFLAAREAGIKIPALCHHDLLEPYGACRLCSVEVGTAPRTRVVASCVYPVASGLVVSTNSERVRRVRKVLLELLLTKAPGSKVIKDLAKEYGARPDRFKKDASFCILCGLCVRYCNEVKRADAVTFISRGAAREVSFIPEVAARECPSCRRCFAICPTNVLGANFELARALTFNLAEK